MTNGWEETVCGTILSASNVPLRGSVQDTARSGDGLFWLLCRKNIGQLGLITQQLLIIFLAGYRQFAKHSYLASGVRSQIHDAIGIAVRTSHGENLFIRNLA